MTKHQEEPVRIERHAAAKVAAQVAGYSRLVGGDEVGEPRMLRGPAAMSPIQGFEIGTSSADVSGLGLGVPVAGRQAPLPTQYAPFVLESPGYATERGLPVVATNDPDSLHQ